MSACPSCGSRVGDAARFCPTCGASLGAACPTCGASVVAGARFCEACGTGLEAVLAGVEERKVVSVLFADVTGSTSLGERLDPERLRSVLSTYFAAMSAVIESWGGTVEKFIGDAIMAVFGVPVVREDDAERALHASLEMLARLRKLNDELRERHGVDLEIRIGVNTGEVIAPVGVPVDQMIVVGDTVNVAARLEQAAEPGAIVVGETTWLAARGAFEFGAPGPLDLKGKAEAVNARRLVATRSEVTRGIPGLSSSMVGRELELESLDRQLADAVEVQRPRMVTIFGPAGIGKSRLVGEFLGLASSRETRPTVLRGRCLAAGPGITYWALGEILRASCGIALDDSAAQSERKLRTCGALLERIGLTEADAAATIFALATTAGLQIRGNPLDAMEPQAVAEELARAWPRVASALASRGPTILVIEDLHWASDQLLDLVERLVTRSTGPLFVLATARPEFAQAHPGFGSGAEEMSSLSLRPLTLEQGSTLVGALLADSNLPDPLRSEILDRAEGNPFFLEELLRRLIDEGAIVREGDRWHVTPGAREVTLPETVQGLLGARIDALEPAEKRALQEAAVIGRIFWATPVERAAGNGEVSGALRQLERKGLIFARPVSSLAGEVEYMFKHALVREVAYATLPKARRARAHAEHAAWVEEMAGDRTEEFADLLAYHYEQAVSTEDADLAWSGDADAFASLRSRAFDALLLGGRVARRALALDRAVDLHRQAVSLASEETGRAVALEELALDHDAAYHGDEGIATYLRALELVRAGAGSATDRARLCMSAARLACKMGASKEVTPPEQIEVLIDEGLATDPDPTMRARLLHLRGEVAQVYQRTKQEDPLGLEARIASNEEALSLAEALKDPELLALIAVGLSSLYELAGDIPRAFEAIWRVGDVVDAIPSPVVRAEMFLQYSWGLIDAGRYRDSVVPSRKGYDLGKEASAHAHMHGTCMRLLGAYHLGRWDEVREMIEEHAALFPQEAGVGCGAVNGGMLWGAVALAHTGEPERARELLEAIPSEHRKSHFAPLALALLATGRPEEARAAAESGLGEEGIWQGEASLALVETLVALEDWVALSSALSEARARIPAQPLLGPVADRAGGVMALATGERDRGVALLRSAIERFRAFEVPFEVARTKEFLAGAEVEEAADLLEGALATYEELGARPHSDRVRALLGRGPGPRGVTT